jgi:DNA-binding CsgD family transcriptional regulator
MFRPLGSFPGGEATLPRNCRNPHRELSNSTVFAASTRSAHVRQPALWRHCLRRQISARRILPASRAFMRPFRLLRLKGGGIDDDRSLLKQKLTVTEREAEVLLWIARCKSNRDIAEILNLSPRTVNKHLEQIYAKLGVENRASAVAVVVRTIGIR